MRLGAAAVRFYVLALLVVAPVVAVLILRQNGSLYPPAQLGLTDSGAVTYYGLPAARALRDVAAAITIGALVLTATVLPPRSPETAQLLTGTRARMMTVAAVSGSAWVWAGLAVLIFTYADVAGLDPFAPGGMQFLSGFLTDVELGQALLLSSSLAAVATVGSLFARRITSAALLALVSVAALWPLATTGHAAGDLNHDVAVNAQMFHLVGVSVWAGGLASLLLVRRHLTSADAATVLRRYSKLAGWGVALVSLSGLTAAYLRLGSFSNVTSSYGILVITKVAALLLLVAAGWWHRVRLLPAASTDPEVPRPFLRLAAAELGVMAVATGIAIALSRTPPPPGPTATTPAEGLLGYSMPPPLDVTTFFTQWRLDTIWGPVALLLAGTYLIGVRRLRHRGDRWPLGRTVAWILGCALLFWATSASPGVYGRVTFSMHMLQHMTIALAAPAFLVLGAPATLALRALPGRRDRSRGPREWLLILVHSRFLRLLGHPVIAGAMFLGSLVIFYSSSLFELSLRSHTAHQLMVAHFLLAGYLLASAVVGIDPGGVKLAYPFRCVVLLMVFGAHALYSVSLMGSTRVLGEPWFAGLGRTWGGTLLSDQNAGATLGWVLGDYPIAILGGALIWSWVRSDMREARRYDRRAERDNDDQLRRYNEQLERMNQRT